MSIDPQLDNDHRAARTPPTSRRRGSSAGDRHPARIGATDLRTGPANMTLRLIRAALNGTSWVAPRVAGRATFYLFCNLKPRSKVRDTERETHHRALLDELSVNGKKVVTYRWGNGERPVLLVHGWQSRAARFAGFVPRLEALGCSPISFDAPGHGDSAGRRTTVLEYREVIRQLQNKYGPFEAVIAHSFGVMATFLSLRATLTAGRLVAVAGVSDFHFLHDEFCRRLQLNARLRQQLRRRIEQDLFPEIPGMWELFDSTLQTDEIALPILVIHDQSDEIVPIGQAQRLKSAYGDQLELITTAQLGHRKILAHPTVIDRAVDFIGLLHEPEPRDAAPSPLTSTSRIRQGRIARHDGQEQPQPIH